VWHFALTKAQSESLEAIQKRAIHITHKLTRGKLYSPMLYCANINSLAFRREDLSRDFFHNIVDPASFLHSLLQSINQSINQSLNQFISTLYPDPRLLPQGLDLLKPFLKSILVPSATVHSYNMVLIIIN